MGTFADGRHAIRVLNMDNALGRHSEVDATVDDHGMAAVELRLNHTGHLISPGHAESLSEALSRAAAICREHNGVPREDGTDTGRGDPRFKAILDQMWELHQKKGADYGSDEDQFSNVRAAAAFGVPPWVGTMIRGNDKMKRIQTMAAKGVLKNESVEDSLIDLAAYSIIALILYREERGDESL